MIHPPWDEQTVNDLNSYQTAGSFAPFFCQTKGCKSILRATERGFVCPEGCGYTQPWAHEWMPYVRPCKEAREVQRINELLLTEGYGRVIAELHRLYREQYHRNYRAQAVKPKRGRPRKRKK